MADIELVIKIPEGLKKDFESEQWTALSCMEMKNALENGTPLEVKLKVELEKIKAEVLKAKPYYQYYIEKEDFILILDNHVSELKGENK